MTTTTELNQRSFALLISLPPRGGRPILVTIGHDNPNCVDAKTDKRVGEVVGENKSLDEYVIENEYFDGELSVDPVWPCAKCVAITGEVAPVPDIEPEVHESEPYAPPTKSTNDEPSQDEQCMAIAKREALARDEKFTRQDLTPELRRAAQVYARDYDGDFEFILKAKRYKTIPEGMIPGVLNTFRAECFRNAKKAPVASQSATTLTLDLVSGKYDVPDEDGVIVTVEVDRGSDNWEGWTFVRVAGEKIGQQRPGESYRGQNVLVLERLQADPVAAAAHYGHRTTTCGICGRHLEDPESVERGIGPVCWGRLQGEA